MSNKTAKATSKLDKNELKRLMREEKAKRIESPLAKYNSIGQLICVICNQVIKSELFWSAHINSKAHLQQVESLKSAAKSKAAGLTAKSEDSATFKRPHPVNENENDFKKARIENVEFKKEVLINNYENEENSDDEENGNDELVYKTEKMEITKQEEEVLKNNELKSTTKDTTVDTKLNKINELPQGFFDDPKKDMQARHIDYNATLDNEFAKFKAELQNEETKNEILIELDEEARDIDRDLEEVDELIHKWSRIEDLHKRKENFAKIKAEKEAKLMNVENDENDEDDSDVDLDSVVNLTLRSKNRC